MTTTNRRSQQEIQEMFAEISPTYDGVNRLLSFGLDRIWRNAVLRLLPEPGGTILDCCAGTGELTRLMASRGHSVTGLDNCKAMLEIAEQKKTQGASFSLIEGDAHALPFPAQTFGAVTNAFSLRNLPDLRKFLEETLRVLLPGGHAIFLELTKPEGGLKLPHRIYLTYFLPWIGGFFSKNGKAYQYLADSIFGFPSPAEIQSLMKSCGFRNVKVLPLSGGIATIWDGEKE